MRTSPFPTCLRFPLPLLSLVMAVAAMLLPAAASAAVQLEIVKEPGVSEEAWVTVATPKEANFDVPGMANNTPKKLSEVPDPLTINKLISGRIYISYGDGVTEQVPFDSPTRFDWAELTVHETPSELGLAESDVADLTAVDQFGIGMRLDTYSPSDERLDWLGDANSDTIFQALRQIPGGPAATVRDGNGNIVRVLSPKLYPNLYPDLGDYVRSMSGQTITLHTAFGGTPFATSQYSGTFGPDGSITLSGTSNPEGQAPSSFTIPGGELIDEIYPAANTPNDLKGALRRDVFAAFSAGLWGGRYGNDTLSFCSNPEPHVSPSGYWCPDGFNRPIFGDARLELSPYPTCEQYAAVIDQYADTYGNPYSDDFTTKKVQIGLDPTKVKTLRLTVLPDSGDAQPKSSGNSNCGAGSPSAAPSPAPVAPAPGTAVKFHLPKKAKLKRHKVKVGGVFCSAACGRVRALARRGHKVVAREIVKRSGPKRPLVLGLTPFGRRAVAHQRKLKVRLDVWVTPPGQATRHVRRPLFLIRGARR